MSYQNDIIYISSAVNDRSAARGVDELLK